MDRYWQSGAVQDAPAVPASNAGGYPANGNPAAGINGTVPGEWWYHVISEEIRNAIIALGGTPDFTQVDQLGNASIASIAQAINGVTSSLAKVATTGQYGDLLDLPNLAVVALTGDYADLSGKPTIPPEYALPPATTSTLGGVIAGPGTTVAADGTLSATLQTVCAQQPIRRATLWCRPRMRPR